MPQPPVDLYLISKKLSLKNQVRQTGFLQATQAVKIQFELDFSKLIFQKSIIDQQRDRLLYYKIQIYQPRK